MKLRLHAICSVLSSGVLACGDQQMAPDAAVPIGTVLVADACGPTNLINNPTALFWIATCDGSIRSLSKLGGEERVLATNEPTASMLAADETFVYWMRAPPNGMDGEILRVPQTGGALQLLADKQMQVAYDLPQQLAVDDAKLYRSQGSLILAMPKDGSGPQYTIASGTEDAFLLVDTEYIYWANFRSVHRQPKEGTTDELLAETQDVIFMPIALTDRALYFWERGLYRIDVIGGGPAALVFDETYAPTRKTFVADDRYVYWPWSRGLQIVRADELGQISAVAELDVSADQLTVDSQFVYWASFDRILYAPHR